MKKNKDVLYYSVGSKIFHWVIALIVILMLSGSFFLDDLPKLYQGAGYMLHKSFGLTVLFLMVIRFLWVTHFGRPELPPTVPHWEKLLSRCVQYAFYLFLLAMPLCGWVLSVAEGHIPSYFGLFQLSLPIAPNKALADLMDESHKVIAWILIALLCLHIAGALKHHFINRDDVLKRMFPRRS